MYTIEIKNGWFGWKKITKEMNNLNNKELDAVSEISRILQEEMARIWDETPIGYNEDNDGYHMGKGLIVNKETWDKYTEASKTEPELDAYEFMIRLIKEEAEKL